MIGEVAQAHDGSLGAAHAYVDAIAATGANAVKFQTHIASAESTPSEPWRVKFSPQDETRYDYWKRMEWTRAQWGELKAHAEEAGLVFLSSPFSLAAVELLGDLGVRAWKIASGELNHRQMIAAIAETRKPVLISSGMSSWQELDNVVAAFSNSARAVFQCTSAYPCPPERLGLNVLGQIRERYGCAVGLSDHSATAAPAIAAVALGAELIEVHVALSRDSFGPDVSSSLLPDELTELVRGVRAVFTSLHHPVDKDAVAAEMKPMRDLFQRSLVPTRDLKKGHVLQAGDLLAKKPGTGIPPERLQDLLGQTLLRDVARDELISEETFEKSPSGETS